MIMENPLFSLTSERILADEGQAVQKPFYLQLQKKFFSLWKDITSSVIIDYRTKTLRLQYNNTILFSHSETHII